MLMLLVIEKHGHRSNQTTSLLKVCAYTSCCAWNYSYFHAHNIGYGHVTNLVAEQSAIGRVLITWTEPSPAPRRGYEVLLLHPVFLKGGFRLGERVNGTSHAVIVPVGTYRVQVVPVSLHYHSTITSVLVTINGKDETRCMGHI